MDHHPVVLRGLGHSPRRNAAAGIADGRPVAFGCERRWAAYLPFHRGAQCTQACTSVPSNVVAEPLVVDPREQRD